MALAANEVFYTYRLPFLSFAATQPTISLDISATSDRNITLSSLLMKTRAGFTYGDKPVDTNPSIIGAWVNSTVSVGEYKTQITFSSKDFMIGPQYIYNCTHTVTFKSALQTLNGTLIICKRPSYCRARTNPHRHSLRYSSQQDWERYCWQPHSLQWFL